KAIILGRTGRNFAAGMSGGVAYVLDEADDFASRCNNEMVGLERIETAEESKDLQEIVQRHANYTGSKKAKSLLENWESVVPKFVKVMPRDYKRVLQHIQKALDSGLSNDEAMSAAFEENARDLARVSGS
ncbi:MAG: hypothetical protein AAFU53_18865, partial [Cyanobacteria bacterium J06632_3]